MYRGENPPHVHSLRGCEVVAYWGAPKNWHTLYLALSHRPDDGFGDFAPDDTYRGERVNASANAKLVLAERAHRKQVLEWWEAFRPEKFATPTAVNAPAAEQPRKPFWRRLFYR